jgi:hypothetical protein
MNSTKKQEQISETDLRSSKKLKISLSLPKGLGVIFFRPPCPPEFLEDQRKEIKKKSSANSACPVKRGACLSGVKSFLHLFLWGGAYFIGVSK